MSNSLDPNCLQKSLKELTRVFAGRKETIAYFSFLIPEV